MRGAKADPERKGDRTIGRVPPSQLLDVKIGRVRDQADAFVAKIIHADRQPRPAHLPGGA